MNRRTISLFAAALLVSGCMTAGQKKNKADAEAAFAAASTSVAQAKMSGGEAYSASRMRTAEDDLSLAREKLKAGDWDEARRRARMAAGVAEDIRSEAETARKRETASTPFKPGARKKKPRGSSGR